MKALVAGISCSWLIWICATFTPLWASDRDSEKTSVAEPELFQIHTLSGEVYHNCRIIKVTPADLTVMHDHGVAKIAFEQLSMDWRKKYQYDPEKAQTFRHIQLSMQKEAEEEQRQLKLKRDQEKKQTSAELQKEKKPTTTKQALDPTPAPALEPLPGEANRAPLNPNSTTTAAAPSSSQDGLFPQVTPIGPVHEPGFTGGRARSTSWRYSDGIYSVEGYVPPYGWHQGYGYGYGNGYGYHYGYRHPYHIGSDNHHQHFHPSPSPQRHQPQHHGQRSLHFQHRQVGPNLLIRPPMTRIKR